MKHLALFSFLLLAVPSLGSAQAIRGWGVEGGASGAYQVLAITQPGGSPAIPRTISWGFTAGVFVELLNMPHLSFALEAAYRQKGRVVTAEEIAVSPSIPGALSQGPSGAKPRLDYAGLGILMKLRAWKEGFVPYAAVGPRFDFLVAKKDDPGRVFDQVKKSDIGVTVAAGIEIVPGRQPVASLEARWSPGFTRVLTAPSLTVKNQSVEFLLALWL